MAEGRVTRIAVSDDTRAHLTSLLFEASLSLHSVVLGLETVTRRLPAPSGLETVTRFAAQAAEALAQFEAAFRDLLDEGETGDAA